MKTLEISSMVIKHHLYKFIYYKLYAVALEIIYNYIIYFNYPILYVLQRSINPLQLLALISKERT